jgi:hypothetical protein
MGRKHVRIMQYDPKQPHHLRYVNNNVATDTPLAQRVHKDALTLCEILGYDMNTCEFAVRDGIPYAIDFMNCAPDADVYSVGQENFDWVVNTMADVLIDRVKNGGGGFEMTGTWPKVMGLGSNPMAAPKTDAVGKVVSSVEPTPAPKRTPPRTARASAVTTPVKRKNKDEDRPRSR